MRHFSEGEASGDDADENDGEGVSARTLRHELRALAMLADIESRPAEADEVALEFDHWCLSLLSQFKGTLTVRQGALLNALDAYFDELSGADNDALWTTEAIRHSPEWSDIRGLALKTLEAFGWRAGATRGSWVRAASAGSSATRNGSNGDGFSTWA